MVEGRVVDLTSELELECLWFCFSRLLQKMLDEVKEHWNIHRIRRSRHDTVSGRPDSLFHLPELHGISEEFLLSISEAEMSYARLHVILKVIQATIIKNTLSMFQVFVTLGNQMIRKKH